VTPRQRRASPDRWQIFTPLPAETYAALRADIARNGVVIPVELDATGTVIDGHHRLRALAELRADGHRLPDAPAIVRPELADGATLLTRYSILARTDTEVARAVDLMHRLAGLTPPEAMPTLLTVAEAARLATRRRR
jgi:ParB-like chromosome segregation protein Spo0J